MKGEKLEVRSEKLPEGWTIGLLKHFVTVHNGREIVKEVDKFSENAIRVFGSGGVFKYTDNYLYDGEAVLFGRKGTLGKPIYTEGKFWAVDTMYFLTFKKNLLAKYCYYMLSAFDWQPFITQTALPSVVASEIVAQKFPIPPLTSQLSLLTFLDRKCAEIDELAALQETMIEELKRYKQSLITETVTGKWKIENGKGKTGKWKVENGKLKDSGVELIGEIPERWEVRKIKTMATLKSGNNLTTNDFLEGEDGYPVYGGNGFRGYYSQYSNDGDFVLIGRQGALCGNINYAHGKFWATDHAVVCYPKCEFVLTWFGESLRAMNLNQYSLSSAQPGLSVDRIRELYMVVPPLSEQQQIADFLDRKCAEIDELIAIKQQKIEALKEYKKSVIFEYVTGKKEV